jgi:hypothetical protein
MKDIKTEVKGSLGPTVKTVEPPPSVEQLKKDTEHNFSDIMEIIKDLESRLLQIERKLSFIVLPDFRTDDEDEYDYMKIGGTD